MSNATERVHLWLANDAGWYHSINDAMAEIEESIRDERDGGAGGALSPEERDALIQRLAEWTEEQVTDLIPPMEGIVADLLALALAEVDWVEIAEDWIEA